MKQRYFLLAALLLPQGLRAQTPDVLRQRQDYLVAPLDKSQVPTRLLADYAHPIAPLHLSAIHAFSIPKKARRSSQAADFFVP